MGGATKVNLFFVLNLFLVRSPVRCVLRGVEMKGWNLFYYKTKGEIIK